MEREGWLEVSVLSACLICFLVTDPLCLSKLFRPVGRGKSSCQTRRRTHKPEGAATDQRVDTAVRRPVTNAGVACLVLSVAGLGHVLYGPSSKASIPLESAIAISSLASYAPFEIQMTVSCQIPKSFGGS